MHYPEIIKVLGGEEVFYRKVRNQMDLIELSMAGISKNALMRLAENLSFSVSQLSELLPITRRTIERYAPDKHFNQAVSEQIIQLAEIAAKGDQVFGDRDSFLLWLKSPCKAFADNTPLSLLRSRFGVEMVMDELGRMEHGVIS